MRRQYILLLLCTKIATVFFHILLMVDGKLFDYLKNRNNAIDWFTTNVMKANPSKFQIVLISSERISQQSLDVANDITLLPMPSVKILGVTIDDQLKLSKHVCACCL